VRFLLLDLNRGIELRPARASSMLVLAVSLAATVFFAFLLW
jgi:succinate dehydrogenase/fumarate reductase cytochrome b subunit